MQSAVGPVSLELVALKMYPFHLGLGLVGRLVPDLVLSDLDLQLVVLAALLVLAPVPVENRLVFGKERRTRYLSVQNR